MRTSTSISLGKEKRRRGWRFLAAALALAAATTLGPSAAALTAGHDKPTPGNSPTTKPTPGSSPTTKPTPGNSPTTKPTPGNSPTTKPPSGGSTSLGPTTKPGRHLNVVAQAQPDQCWVGIGKKPLPIGPNGTCPDGGKPRITQDYLWGYSVDDAERSLWFGTAPNVACTGMGLFFPAMQEAGLTPPKPFDHSELSCEFDASYGAVNNIPPSLGVVGDTVAGKIFQYDIARSKLIDRTPPTSDPNFQNVGGIRAAGGAGGVMFLAGIESSVSGGTQGGGVVDMFAYRQSDGKFLGSQRFPQYSNVKNYKALDGHLYVGMNLTNPESPGSSPNPTVGAVLKWTGNEANPFRFQTVGRLGAQPAYFGLMEGRIVVNTWVGTGNAETAGLYISPPLKDRGLTRADSNSWKRVFGANQYTPDPVTALNQYGMGAQEYQGWLYFSISTVGVGASTLAHLAAYPQLKTSSLTRIGQTYLKSEPAASVLRIRHLGQRNQQVQLLYGESRYWNFDESTGRNGRWVSQPNKLHQSPRYGPGGFGDRWADYAAWGMNVFRGQLYMGGFDTVKALRDIALNPEGGIASQLLGRPVSRAELNSFRKLLFGNSRDAFNAGPVWVFGKGDKPARPLTTTGFNNPTNWGVRGIQVVGDKYIFFGTNSGWNYPTTPQPQQTVRLPGGITPIQRAGWQLIKYAPPPGAETRLQPAPPPTVLPLPFRGL